MIAGRYNVAEAKAIDVKKANISFRVYTGIKCLLVFFFFIYVLSTLDVASRILERNASGDPLYCALGGNYDRKYYRHNVSINSTNKEVQADDK